MENKKLVESIYIIRGTLSEAEYHEVLTDIKEKLLRFKIEKIE